MSDRTAETVPMTAETLEALKGSIAKWEAIVAGTGEDNGDSDCPLCQLFSGPWCGACPVKARTGFDRCSGSPYTEWLKATGLKKNFPVRVTSDVERVAAQAELDFLKSLLPGQTP